MGLLKGLGVTLKTFFQRATTQQYPHVKPDLPPRTRGVIALMEENCTVCMLCARECPDWCIYIDSHKEVVPPKEEGGRARTRNMLDRFAIDFALCMYCGICVEVCPFDALFWSPEFEYSTYSVRELTHEMDQLRVWMDTVPPPPALEVGAEEPKEIIDGLEAARKAAERAAVAAAPAAEAGPAGTSAAGAAAASPAAREEDIHVEAEIDQEVFDQLVAEGTSERVARAKAKAAFVRREKARIRRERAGSESPPEAGDPNQREGAAS
ncbi:MAG: 4Fe-4S dicluster domain-containing protein [Nitriliruptorales bacterium]|nr:4Fe-4S dicluster domain-containing protein [Nitriliruptorales bacterium]